jgi:hypothetical protein
VMPHRRGRGGLAVRGRSVAAAVAGIALASPGCASGPPATPPPDGPQRARPLPPPLPDPAGWGVPVLAIEQGPDRSLWLGTNGHGIKVLRDGEREWQHIEADTGAAALRSPRVNALRHQGTALWYGTPGQGFGVTRDGGATWRTWTAAELGPRWQHVALGGIRTRGDTVYIATSDGIRITWDGGATWRCVTGQAPPPPEPREACRERVAALPNGYLLSLEVGPDGRIWAGTLQGLAVSADAGRGWRVIGPEAGVPAERIRAITVHRDSSIWVATERAIHVDSTRRGTFREADLRVPGWPALPGSTRALIASPGLLPPTIATSFGLAAGDGESGRYRIYYLSAGEIWRPTADLYAATWWGPPLWPLGGSAAGLNRTLAGDVRPGPAAAPRAAPAVPAPRPWLGRPIGEDANPFADPTLGYGAGDPPRRGIVLHNPWGTPVRAAADGEVVFAGAAADGSLSVVVRHAARWEDRWVFTVYHHNGALGVAVGDRVREGQEIARVGATGGVDGHRLGFEVHIAPVPDVEPIITRGDAAGAFTVNPHLWIGPRAGTGVLAGRVLDAAGQPVPGARIRGLVLDQPAESPSAFVEAYVQSVRPDPAWGEHFAVGDVPAGDFLLGVEIEGARVWRRVRVEAGRIAFVEFRP